MSSASASGADSGQGSGAARNREHNQGNQGRSYTVEQKAAVLRIRRCSPTAFYDILGLESVRTTVTDGEIKKAYRKLSLLTHPDKNGHEHADEAFKMVSRAFGVLGDKEKRDKFDRFGTDPDSRFASAQAQNPFSGFARQASGGQGGGGPFGGGGAGGGGGGGWEGEMTPEEMFARFFGGGFGNGFGGFDTGPQFVFNFGGGPGIRVHQFGGPRPRRRPRDATDNPNAPQTSTTQFILGLLPILFLFVFPLLSNLFGGTSQPATPRMVFEHAEPPYTHKRATANLHIPYFVNPADVKDWPKHKFTQMDKVAELNFLRGLRVDCAKEEMQKQNLVDAAQGWFRQDPDKMRAALQFEMPSCERLRDLKIK